MIEEQSQPALTVRFLESAAPISAPPVLGRVLSEFFALARGEGGGVPVPPFEISEVGPGAYSVVRDGVALRDHAGTGTIIRTINEALVAGYPLQSDEVLWRAAAVGWGETSILLVGDDEEAVTVFLSWMIDRGFSYVSQSLVRLSGDRKTISGFAGPLAVSAMAARRLGDIDGFKFLASVPAGDMAYVRPEVQWAPFARDLNCAMIVFVSRAKGSPPRIGLGTAHRTIEALCAGSTPKAAEEMRREAARVFVETRPCLEVYYDDIAQMTDVVDRFLRYIIEDELPKEAVERHISTIMPPSWKKPPAVFPVMPRSNRKFERVLTIGMATYDDFDGVYFSLQSMRMYHPEILEHVEFIVIDNHPNGPAGQPLQQLEKKIPNYRYIPNTEIVGTAIRDQIFAEAGGRFVLSMDCHVLFVQGALNALLRYFARHPESPDLIQGPIIWDELATVNSHWDPEWRRGMYGTWAKNPAADDFNGPAFEIPMMGLGVFACRRDVWPGFNPKFTGFGGEEGYIHEKFRQRGARVLCLPALRWLHRFQRPLGVPYPIKWADRFRNYLLGREELGLPADDVIAHMREHLGGRFVDDALAELRKRGEFPA